MFNKRVLKKATDDLDKVKKPTKSKDIIYDPAGQWRHPGQPTRIPSNTITMEGVDYPVLGIPNYGEPKVMMPGQYYEFPEADYVDEYPEFAEGGSAGCPKGFYYNGKKCVKIPKNAFVTSDPNEYKQRIQAYRDSSITHQNVNKYNNALQNVIKKALATGSSNVHDPYYVTGLTSNYGFLSQGAAKKHTRKTEAQANKLETRLFENIIGDSHQYAPEEGRAIGLFDHHPPVKYKSGFINSSDNYYQYYKFPAPKQPVVFAKEYPKDEVKKQLPKKTLPNKKHHYPTGYDEPIIIPLPPGKRQVGENEIQTLDPKTGRVKTVIEPVYVDMPEVGRLPIRQAVIDQPKKDIVRTLPASNTSDRSAEVYPEYIEPGVADTEVGMEWVNKPERYIDWQGTSIGYRLPRFRKPGHGGDLIKKGKQRYIHLPTIETRNTAELVPEEEEYRRGGIIPKYLKMPKNYGKAKYSSNISATNRLFAKNFLFRKERNKIYDPNAKYAEGGEQGCPKGYAFNPKTGECIEWNPDIRESYDQPTSFDPVGDVIYMNPNDRPEGMSDEEYAQMYQDQLEHEQLHRLQWKNDELKGESKTPLRMPSTVDNEDFGGDHYYNRRGEEVNYLHDYWKNHHPDEAAFIPDDVIYNFETDPAMYQLPWTVEGEARGYEHATHDGMESLFPKRAYGGVPQYAPGGSAGCKPGYYWNGKECVKLPKGAKVITDPKEYEFRKAAYDDSLSLFNLTNAQQKIASVNKDFESMTPQQKKDYYYRNHSTHWKAGTIGANPRFFGQDEGSSKIVKVKDNITKNNLKAADTDYYHPTIKPYKHYVNPFSLTENFLYKKPKQPVVFGNEPSEEIIKIPLPPNTIQVGEKEVLNLDEKTGIVTRIIEPIYEKIPENKTPEPPVKKEDIIVKQAVPTSSQITESQYIEEGVPDTTVGMEWVNKPERYIDWNGRSIGYNLPRFRKPGHGGDLIRKGKRRYLHLPTIEKRNTAYIEKEEEYQDGGVSPIEGDLISKVLMNRNRGVDFVDRAYALGDNPGTPLFNVPDDEEFGNRMSHKMSWGTDDQGQTWMFPTVLNPNDEAIKVPNQYADYISSEGYKNATGMNYQDGGQYRTKLTPEEEFDFQSFFRTLPDNLQTDDDTYDIRGYWDSEGRPEAFNYDQPKEKDGYYHAYSINQNTGEYLKSPAHDTFQHAVDEDRKIGYRPITNVQGRNIVTYNESIADPEEQSFLRNTEGPANYIETELTDDEIQAYRDGGYIVEDISVPSLTKAQRGLFKKKDKQDPNKLEYREPVKVQDELVESVTPFPEAPKDFKKGVANLKEVEVGPYWLGISREYSGKHNKQAFIDKKKRQYLRNTNRGLAKAAGLNMENFPKDVEKNFINEYNYKRNNYVVKKLFKDAGISPNKREEWVDKISDADRVLIANSKYGNKLKPSIWARTLAGLGTMASKFSPEIADAMERGDLPGLTREEQRAIKNAKIKGIPVGGVEALAGADAVGVALANAVEASGNESYGGGYKKAPGLLSGDVMPKITDDQIAVLNPFTYTVAYDVAPLAKGLLKGATKIGKASVSAGKTGIKAGKKFGKIAENVETVNDVISSTPGVPRPPLPNSELILNRFNQLLNEGDSALVARAAIADEFGIDAINVLNNTPPIPSQPIYTGSIDLRRPTSNQLPDIPETLNIPIEQTGVRPVTQLENDVQQMLQETALNLNHPEYQIPNSFDDFVSSLRGGRYSAQDVEQLVNNPRYRDYYNSIRVRQQVSSSQELNDLFSNPSTYLRGEQNINIRPNVDYTDKINRIAQGILYPETLTQLNTLNVTGKAKSAAKTLGKKLSDFKSNLNTAINKANVKLGEVIDKSKIETLKKPINSKDIDNEVNKYLAEGLGIKKGDVQIKVKTKPDGTTQVLIKPKEFFKKNKQLIEDTYGKGSFDEWINTVSDDWIDSGYLGLKSTSGERVQPRKFTEILSGKKLEPSVDFGYGVMNVPTPGLKRAGDFPFANWESGFRENLLENLGVSGELTQAYNKALKGKGYGIYSGGTGHLTPGAKRYVRELLNNRVEVMNPDRAEDLYRLLNDESTMKAVNNALKNKNEPLPASVYQAIQPLVFKYKRKGGSINNDFIESELSQKEIDKLVAQGYIVETVD